MHTTRPSLKSLKLQAYSLYGVANTRQLKKLIGGHYDFRYRATWLEILGMGQSADLALLLFHAEEWGSNNIVPFELPLSALARRVDEILDKDLYD